MFTLMLPFAILSFIYLLGYDIHQLSGVGFALIAGAELVSILQNFIVARTKKSIQEFDAITYVMQKILDVVK
jgi:hypothetical protein